ncbi:MAG: DUF3877 family protein [Lachnospiraceae bacterium]|nr:DUF3877 family protein [Lachnospiraceae bacterium]
MNTEKLVKNIIDQIKEAQIKLGYMRESMRFYYPLSSVNAMLNMDFKSTGELTSFINSKNILDNTIIGKLLLSVHDDRIEVSVSADGVTYVYENIPDPPFLRDIINFFATHHNAGIDEIRSIFEKYGNDYVCEGMPAGEDFDYVMYFKDKSIDEYYYCIKNEMHHTIYHRFSKVDFQMLVCKEEK